MSCTQVSDEESECRSVNLPSINQHGIGKLAALDMHSVNVATEEPSELPVMLAILALAPHAVMFASLDLELAVGWPLVGMLYLVARHLGW